MATRNDNKSKELTPKQKAARDQHRAEEILRTYCHTSRALHKSIIAALPPLKDDKGEYDMAAVTLVVKSGKVMDLLAEKSRYWAISLHWLYTVCVPNIIDVNNPAFSPVWRQYAASFFPPDRFGELARPDDDGETLTPHRNKLCADTRYVSRDIWDYGSAWNEDGDVIKVDIDGHPILDGWMGFIAQCITALQDACLRQCTQYNHFRAFLLGGVRDDMVVKRDALVIHKSSHAHVYTETPRQKSRYQMMEAFGVIFDDYTRTFKWIAESDVARPFDRVSKFLDSLSGVIKNYLIPEHYDSELQYLVHQSKGAIKDQKATYRVAEVTAWLPDDKYDDYEHYAGVYDNEAPASGLNAEIIRNLHSPANIDNDTVRFVGTDAKHNAITYEMCRNFRAIGRKGHGKRTFTENSKLDMMNIIMTWVRQGKLYLMDFESLIHASFDDGDADALLADPKFIMALEARIKRYIDSKRDNPNFHRDMQTIVVTGQTGGLGKTRIAKGIGAVLDCGHEPVQADPWEPDKTYDPLEKVKYQPSVMVDEIKVKFFSWPGLKSLLDPTNKAGVASRYSNGEGMLLRHLFLTQVLPGGISTYIRGVLHFAKGISDEDYMTQDDKGKWHPIIDDIDAGYAYLGALSQLLRRLPVWVELWPTDSGIGTNIKVSVLNYDPHGQNITSYDYVHTVDSIARVNTVIRKASPDNEVAWVAKKVSDMIDAIQAKAQAAFDIDPNMLLNDVDGFIADDCDFGYRLTSDGEPYITDDLNTPLSLTKGEHELTLDNAKVLIRKQLHYDFVMLGFDAAVEGRGEPKRFDLRQYSAHRDKIRDKFLYLFSSADAFDSFIDEYRRLIIDNFVLLTEDMTTIAAWRHNEVNQYGQVDTTKVGVV
ncbi:hypothetical protein EFO98_12125 [Lactiplantibacillus argentoratensis]|uniref:hypothetical protein n=1 Tax=Lactiplantibacillus argentoratensis TaxID=271881 RepID=UPI0021AAEDA4|nr:hypothetical protein [Lactiplantibacillus argentoratensis]MCT4444452.1 hypothetical protein [Lactiplantibacillus argentoratensis]